MSAPTPDRAALAEPAPEPPSVAEAREAFVLAVARCRDCGEYGVLCGPQHEALADALIAAVRAATIAEAVRVVERERVEISRTHADKVGKGREALWETAELEEYGRLAPFVAALRALGVQP